MGEEQATKGRIEKTDTFVAAESKVMRAVKADVVPAGGTESG